MMEEEAFACAPAYEGRTDCTLHINRSSSERESAAIAPDSYSLVDACAFSAQNAGCGGAMELLGIAVTENCRLRMRT